MITTSSPGKLFIAGEWAVLEPGSPAIVAAVDKRVECSIKPARDISVSVEDFGISGKKAVYDGGLRFPDAGQRDMINLKFAKTAIEASLSYLQKWEPFSVTTRSAGLNIDYRLKYGFGSSSAAVVSIISSILAFHGKEIKSKKGLETVFKLSCIAHYLAQGKSGSAADIAAAVYGGVIAYKRFSPEWLDSRMKEEGIRGIVKEGWPSLEIAPLPIPHNLHLLAAWTGKVAFTPEIMERVEAFKTAWPAKYSSLIRKISGVVREAVDLWNEGEWHGLMEKLNRNHELLSMLSKESGAGIETKELREIAGIARENGAAGKLSGAGGGDCGIAVCFGSETANNVMAAWKKAGFEIPDVKVDSEGLKVQAGKAGTHGD